MTRRILPSLATGSLGFLAFSMAASSAIAAPVVGQSDTGLPLTSTSDADAFAIFKPNARPERHQIDYEIWDFALKNLVVNMGPSLRQTARSATAALGTRVRQGHNSRYRLEGSMLGFSFLDKRAIDSFGEYRRELQELASTLDISTLPRNEQLAFWFNLHNVAMVEQISNAWPVRQPRTLEVGGVPLNDAKFITIRGINMSLRDIREKIVFSNWRDPRVIYGFWLGEIGSPALERSAFTGGNVNSLLSLKAEDFINSLRGVQKRGKTLDVSTIYEDARPYFFPNFEADLRKHMSEFASEDVMKILDKTTQTEARISEWDIADLAGGRRGSIAQQAAGVRISQGVAELLTQRARKFDRMERKEIRTGRVFFTELVLPGDPPAKNEVE